MIVQVYFIPLIFYIAITRGISEEPCDRWDKSYTKYLATKTPYREIANVDANEKKFEGCEAYKIWMIVRHGTRYPGKTLIQSVNSKLYSLKHEIVSGYESGHNIFCSDVHQLFDRWFFNANYKVNKHLTTEGEAEMMALGQRFQKRFPKLFPKIKTAAYKFRSTDKSRTIASKKHFMIGLLGKNFVESVWPIDNPIDMEIIRFYKLCPRWTRDVDKNPLSLLERMKYEGTEDWSIMTKNISARLGLDYVIDQETLHTMYTVCAFETAWQRVKRSPWCAVFTREELAELELSEDLEYYHIDGYGHPLNYLQACPAIRDAIKHLTSDKGPTTSVSFTHSGTILKLLAHFGLYNDTTTKQRLSDQRQWRVGKIDAFGSNIALVSYKCGDEMKFEMLHQERPVYIEGCPSSGLCPMQVLLKAHGSSVDNCKFTKMCSIPNDTNSEL